MYNSLQRIMQLFRVQSLQLWESSGNSHVIHVIHVIQPSNKLKNINKQSVLHACVYISQVICVHVPVIQTYTRVYTSASQTCAKFAYTHVCTHVYLTRVCVFNHFATKMQEHARNHV